MSFLGSIVRIRVRLGRDALASAAATDGQVVILDEFNEPALKLPQLGDTVTDQLPAWTGRSSSTRRRRSSQVEALIAEA